jgi:hypothetical protein
VLLELLEVPWGNVRVLKVQDELVERWEVQEALLEPHDWELYEVLRIV